MRWNGWWPTAVVLAVLTACGPAADETNTSEWSDAARAAQCKQNSDRDHDGFPSVLCGGTDCDDADPNVHPGATEMCGDGTDQDCSGADLACPESRTICVPQTEVCGDGIDQDCDGADLPCASEGGTPVQEASTCETAPLRTTGTVHYYCDCQGGAAAGCVPGDDANAGTSPSAPRRSISGAFERFRTMAAGDTVALCRGGAWAGSGFAADNANCRGTSESTYCDFRDYGDPAKPKPRINAAGATVLNIWNSDRAYEGYRFWNLDIRGNNTGDFYGPYGIQMLGIHNYIDFCGLTVMGHGQGMNLDPRVDSTRGHHISIRHSHFEANRGHAIGGNGNYLVIDSNQFVNDGDRNAMGAGYDGWFHEVYLACAHQYGDCVGVEVKNNSFRSDPDGTWLDGGRCGGVRLIIRGQQPGIVIENNQFTGSSAYPCGSISTSGSNNTTEIHDAVFHRNRIFWSTNSHQALQVDACVNCVATDNVIELGAGGLGIVSPTTTNAEKSNFATTTGTVIRNNTVRIVNGGGTPIQAGPRPTQAGSTEGQDFVVENNVVWAPSGVGCMNVYRPTASGHPFTSTSYPSTATNTAGNYCVNNGAAPTVLWADPASRNYTPADASPILGTGNSTYYSPTAIGTVQWSPADLGVVRAAPIDIGATQR